MSQGLYTRLQLVRCCHRAPEPQPPTSMRLVVLFGIAFAVLWASLTGILL